MKQQLKKVSLQLTLMTLLSASLLQVTAQSSMQLSKIYLEGGIGATTNKGINSEVGLTAIFKNKWSVSVSRNSIEEMTPKNEPSDYQPETGYALFIPYTFEETVDMNIVSLTAGRYFQLGRKFSATVEGGLSYVKGETVNYERTQQVSTFIIIAASTSSNYKTIKENKSTVGGMLKADLTWSSRFVGLGLGVFANFNSIQSPVGVQLKLMLGKMRRETRNKS